MINFQDNHEVLEKVKAIELEGGIKKIGKGVTRDETERLFRIDDCICSINFETIKDSKKTNNGFGLKFSDVPYKGTFVYKSFPILPSDLDDLPDQPEPTIPPKEPGEEEEKRYFSTIIICRTKTESIFTTLFS